MSGASALRTPVTYRPMRYLRRSKGLHKLLYNRLGLPLDVSEAAIRRLKQAWNPAQMGERRRLARMMPRSDSDERLRRDGFLKLETSSWDHLAAALVDCEQAFETSSRTAAIGATQAAGAKQFLVSVIRDRQALQYGAVMDLAISPSIIELVSGYFGAVPLLSSIRLWWSPPNASVVDSQLFHCDREDQTQLKVLVNVSDVTAEAGPFTLIPADASARIKRAVDYSYRDYQLSDEDIEKAGGLSEAIALLGTRGTAHCVDSSRCLHYGSRSNSKLRLMLMMRYTRYEAPNVTMPVWMPAAGRFDRELDELQRLVLGLSAG